MNDDVFYDVLDVPLSDRESFNNTISLLTMVKSEYYYIIGFSRTAGVIRVGFDFDTITEGKITRELTIDFKSSSMKIILSCNVLSLDSCYGNLKSDFGQKSANFFIENGNIRYVDKISKDTIMPVSVRTMNSILLKAKRQIADLLMTIH